MTVMKKLMILAVVAALIGISAPQVSAQVPSSSQGTSTQPDDRQSTQPEDMSAPQPSTGTSTSGSEGTVVSQYSEVKAIDLPAAVTRALNEKHPGYKTEKAFIGKDGTYKIKVSKGEENQTLFLDARGEAVKMQK
jgi:hypothetical protein